MKPSSLAAIILRLVALLITVCGVFTLLGAFLTNWWINYMIEQNGAPSTLTGKIMGVDFPASSTAMIFTMQAGEAAVELFAAYLLFRFSLAIGLWLGRGLDPAPEAVEQPKEPEYYLMVDRKSTGPFPLSVLLRRLRMGTLLGSAQVRGEGTRWVPLQTLNL